MRTVTIALGLLMLGVAVALSVREFRSMHVPEMGANPPLRQGIGAPQENSAIEAAETKLRSESAASSRLRRWASGVTWVGLFLSGVVTLIAAAGGPGPSKDLPNPLPPASPASQPDQGALRPNNVPPMTHDQSRFLVRLVAILVALGTLTTAVSQRLYQNASGHAVLADGIGKAIVAAERILEDPNSDTKARVVATQELRNAIELAR